LVRDTGILEDTLAAGMRGASRCVHGVWDVCLLGTWHAPGSDKNEVPAGPLPSVAVVVGRGSVAWTRATMSGSPSPASSLGPSSGPTPLLTSPAASPVSVSHVVYHPELPRTAPCLPGGCTPPSLPGHAQVPTEGSAWCHKHQRESIIERENRHTSHQQFDMVQLNFVSEFLGGIVAASLIVGDLVWSHAGWGNTNLTAQMTDAQRLVVVAVILGEGIVHIGVHTVVWRCVAWRVAGARARAVARLENVRSSVSSPRHNNTPSFPETMQSPRETKPYLELARVAPVLGASSLLHYSLEDPRARVLARLLRARSVMTWTCIFIVLVSAEHVGGVFWVMRTGGGCSP
jgi:hypothetical protein